MTGPLQPRESRTALDFRREARSYKLPIGRGHIELTFERDWPAVWIEPHNLKHFALPPNVLRALADEIERRHA